MHDVFIFFVSCVHFCSKDLTLAVISRAILLLLYLKDLIRFHKDTFKTIFELEFLHLEYIVNKMKECHILLVLKAILMIRLAVYFFGLFTTHSFLFPCR